MIFKYVTLSCGFTFLGKFSTVDKTVSLYFLFNLQKQYFPDTFEWHCT